ncbi:cytochrome ubiquinol oxidase subunit I [Geminicoccaceae bacterium 1502E]|nr:cytochrome ubiquinol oxidase subunit I [Geminicoccaceae bacterium 1502E]
MEQLDPLILARIQFAFTISFHILFPAFTIGLASYLAVLEGLFLWTRKDEYRTLFFYWVKPFAVSFAMGVVSGIVLSYQFGTNWSAFSESAGPIMGPLLAYEVITAFFLEAGFLGIMLFGWNRVGRGLHFFATLMVAVGTLISSFWILSANSWMHTPAGHVLEDGMFRPLDWFEVIFNPSFPYRLVHMVLAAYLTTALVVGATGAWHLLRGRRHPAVRRMFSMAMWMAALVAPVQIVAGDFHGLNTLEHQPAKIAAMEGHFETQKGAPLILFGMPDMEALETRWALEIPRLGSLILTHDLDGEVKGLADFPAEERPNAPLIFWTFRVMVGIGLAMAALGLGSLWLRWREELYSSPRFHRVALLMGPSGFVAVLCGWITTEVGRQPWLVYGLFRTADGLSPVPGMAVASSLAMFVLVYCLVFGVGTVYLLRLLRRPVSEAEEAPEEGTPARPISAATGSDLGEVRP